MCIRDRWGDSYTGGQVVAVAACDPRPRAVVAQCPVFGAALPAQAPDADFLKAFKHTLLEGDVTGTPETTTGPLPVVSFDPSSVPSLLAPIQAFRWFIDYGGRPGSGWTNRVSRVIPPTPVLFAPILCAPFVKVPVLLMVAPADEMVHANVEVTRHAYGLLAGPKRWVDVDAVSYTHLSFSVRARKGGCRRLLFWSQPSSVALAGHFRQRAC